ncbi:unnamed protein product [Owenia fusiformis]|uniref:Uncharacterized protein n=1 Tax=Owenia fusiformis TaxID=6347 RepID=A0A8J1XIH6_OWEFU|nr:unnamed protein product [Owenia fusiformis]
MLSKTCILVALVTAAIVIIGKCEIGNPSNYYVHHPNCSFACEDSTGGTHCIEGYPNAYYHCINGTKSPTQFCPDDLMFNPFTLLCDWPWNVTATCNCSQSVTPRDPIAAFPFQTPQETRSIQQNFDNLALRSDNVNCTDSCPFDGIFCVPGLPAAYYWCLFGQKSRATLCPPGLFFHPVYHYCDYEEHVNVNCTCPENEPTYAFYCSNACPTDGWYCDPYNPHAYYQCIDGIPLPSQYCPYFLVFNQTSERCDFDAPTCSCPDGYNPLTDTFNSAFLRSINGSLNATELNSTDVQVSIVKGFRDAAPPAVVQAKAPVAAASVVRVGGSSSGFGFLESDYHSGYRNSGFGHRNSGYGHSSGHGHGNSGHRHRNSGYGNSGHSHRSSGYGHGSSGHKHGHSGHSHRSSGYGHGSSGHKHGHSGHSHRSSGYGHGNSGYGHGNSGHSHRGSGYGHGNSGHSHRSSGHGDSNHGYRSQHSGHSVNHYTGIKDGQIGQINHG